MPSTSGPRHQKIPFIAGTVGSFARDKLWSPVTPDLTAGSAPLCFIQSTSPSHSVHANMQSILHMMKHHQPQLCERVSALHRSGRGIRKNLQKAFPSSSAHAHEREGEIEPEPQPLGSLSDLLLALQDELGQMSL